MRSSNTVVLFSVTLWVPPNTPSVNWSLGSVGSPDSASHWSDRGGRFWGAVCSVIGVKEEEFFWHVHTSFLCAPKWHPTIKPLSSDFYPCPVRMMGTACVCGRGVYTHLVLLHLTQSFNLTDRLFSWLDFSASTGCPHEQPHTALIWSFIF